MVRFLLSGYATRANMHFRIITIDYEQTKFKCNIKMVLTHNELKSTHFIITRTHTHTHTHERTHTHARTYRHMHTHTPMHTHTHAHEGIHIHTYTHTCTHTCTHTHTHRLL